MLVAGRSLILATRIIYNRYLFGPSALAPSDTKPASAPIISRGLLNSPSAPPSAQSMKENKFAFFQKNFSNCSSLGCRFRPFGESAAEHRDEPFVELISPIEQALCDLSVALFGSIL